MKKIWIGALLIVVALVAIAATNAFAFGVPSSLSDAANAPKDVAYDACKAWESQNENNTSVNMGNIRSKMSGSDFTNLITETDKPKRLELRADYQKFATVKVSCNKEKCSSIYCSKK